VELVDKVWRGEDRRIAWRSVLKKLFHDQKVANACRRRTLNGTPIFANR
jgi:hypothetical protein